MHGEDRASRVQEKDRFVCYLSSIICFHGHGLRKRAIIYRMEGILGVCAYSYCTFLSFTSRDLAHCTIY